MALLASEQIGFSDYLYLTLMEKIQASADRHLRQVKH
ncbi:hypothetical protein Q667_16790 [Marinobacter sp. C1S70]|nr:hypothetical protein Q667_16790 [Marinobacter sp. C1S70]